MLFELILYVMTGLFAGVAAGLLGVGGGLIIVPLLLLIFNQEYTLLAADFHAHIAIATSLATIIFTSISAILAQQKKQAIIWSLFWLLLPGIIVGSFIGAWLAVLIPHKPLVLIFLLFLSFVALKMWFSQSSPRSVKSETHKPIIEIGLYRSIPLNLITLCIGIVSAIVGIGGGTMTVPYLSQYIKPKLIPLKNAIAISSALGLPIAIFASLGFYVQTLNQQITEMTPIPMSIGFVYLPAFITISLSAFITAKLGVYLSHRLDKKLITQIFSILLLLQAIKLFFSII